MDLEEVWRIREEDVYPALFGPGSGRIYTLSQEFFSKRFQRDDVDPRWLFYGVLAFAPTSARQSWLYVTSAHSNPWDEEPASFNPDGISGAGVEFVFETGEAGDWAVLALQGILAFDVLLRAGQFGDKPPLDTHDRIPLRAPINGNESCHLRNIILMEPTHFPATFQLPSGGVRFLSIAAVTDGELAEAKATSSERLLDRLRAAGHLPVNDVRRTSIA
jgi:hypothetical protein